MEERLKSYIRKMEAQSVQWERQGEDAMTEQEKKRHLEDLLIQISFFQHERLVHLIVTVIFALLTMLAIVGTLIFLLILLIPYIRHYYILENGVQKLYQYYDKLVS